MDSDASSQKNNNSFVLEEARESVLHTSERHDSDENYGATQAEFYKSPSIYYGVALSADKKNAFNSPLVFSTKVDALKVINQFPGSRFRQFSSYEDASEFASLPVEEACAVQPSSPLSPLCPPIEEKESNYKSVSSQELVQLRKAIEMGDKNRFLEYVWSNPRYLINSADGPTILQVGSRYNALHVAAKTRQTELCRTVLNTISDLKFLVLLYQDDQMLKIRRSHLLDLYLNMPDKALSESPLHFASKYGAVEILQILLSYPECEKNKPNKYGILPERMICERDSRFTDYKNKMLKMFTDEHYVPVLRDKDNIREPIIGEPCTSHLVAEAMSGSPRNNMKSNLVACAFAGPMLYEEAKEFYRIWRRKHCPKLNYTPDVEKVLKDICKSDSEKGLERIGRKLAKDLSTGWIEYWNILGTWCDISSSQGLQLLEEHIIKNNAKKIESVSAEKEQMAEEMHIAICNALAKEASQIALFPDEEEFEEEFYTPPQTPVEMDTTYYVLAPESPESDSLLIESELSSDDIDLYRAIEKVEVSSDHYPYVCKWKHMVEKKLGPLFNPESKVSCTPPSSAAAVRSAVKTRSLAKRVLF